MKKSVPTRRQGDVLTERRSFGDNIRNWLEARRAAAALRRRNTEKAAAAGRSRGVDRVPERYRLTPAEVEWIHEHTAPVRNRRTRRWNKGTPYRNPARRARLEKSGRLRKDLP